MSIANPFLVVAANSAAEASADPVDTASADRSKADDAAAKDFYRQVLAPLGDPPTAKFPISKYTEQVQISPDGNEVGVLIRQPTIRVDQVIAGHASIILTAVLVLWLFVEVIRAWRRRNRGRANGEPHCRKCDYQLTGATASNCPECGLELTPKNIIAGSSRRVWPRPLVVFGVAVVAGTALQVYFESVSEWLSPRLPAWHIAWLHEWAEYDENWNWMTRHDDAQFRVEVYSLDDWKLLRAVRLDGAPARCYVMLGARLRNAYAVIEDQDGLTNAWSWSLTSGERTLIGQMPTTVDSGSTPGTTADERWLVVDDHRAGFMLFPTQPGSARTLGFSGYQIGSEWIGSYDEENVVHSMITGKKVTTTKASAADILAIDEAQKLLIRQNEDPDNHSAIVESMPDGQTLMAVPFPSRAKVPMPFNLQLIEGAVPVGSGGLWAMVEVQTWDPHFGQSHLAIGVWSTKERRYLASFDGPHVGTMLGPVGRLTVSEDGRRAVMVGGSYLLDGTLQDTDAEEMNMPRAYLYLYDFSEYLSK